VRAARRLARSAYAKAQTAAIALLGRALAAGARHRLGRPAADGGRVTIVIAHAYGMGGTIRTALNLAGHLARDREVEIISVVRRRDRPWFGWPPGVRVSALDDQRPSADPGGWRGRLIDLLRRCPSVLVHVEDHAFGACSLWTDIGFVRRLRALGPGILVTTRPAFNLIAAHLAPPSVVTVAQEHMHVNSHGPRLLAEMRRRYARLDALAVLTEADRRDYERLFAGGGPRLEHIPNAPPRLAGGVADPAGRVAIAAGRLTTQKGFDMLIPAWAAVAERHPEWTLRIYGNGPKRRRLRRLIAEHDLFTDVLLMGPSPRLGEAMGGASLYVMSSRFEGFPMVLLEALTKGLPIVSFDCPTGPRDIVEDGRDGVLVPPKDPAALSAALLALVEDEERRRRYAAAALQAGARYDIAAIGATWDALFAELVSARRTAAR
jgi:glycosyltransferase involved in cell wall biosynthesis